MIIRTLILIAALSLILQSAPQQFGWPDGRRVALSLSFDDARLSQIDVGLPLFERLGSKATFYLVPSTAERRLEGWKKAAAAGHEIANHTLNHPCSGNFPWAREKALENYSMEKMRSELLETNRRLEAMLGVRPVSFAYPCGQTFIGRGIDTRSYVPLVAEHFITGRGWMDEAPNDPAWCDMAQLTGIEMDGRDFEQILPIIERAREAGHWVVLGGHEIGQGGNQTTRVAMLEKLVRYAQDPANQVWLAPVGTVAKYVLERRGK
ncbi:MAG: polysaccharide deacetylase family protein [Acidobacteriota bacterium]|nr:MAG: polysaccharide deacetylase family protein [Acidobacteriota bacterium]